MSKKEVEGLDGTWEGQREKGEFLSVMGGLSMFINAQSQQRREGRLEDMGQGLGMGEWLRLA